MKNKIEIIYEDYDEDNYFVCFVRDNNDTGIEFALCDFVDEMNHWDIPTRIANKNEKVGYVISKKVPKDLINTEITRFKKHNQLSD